MLMPARFATRLVVVFSNPFATSTSAADSRMLSTVAFARLCVGSLRGTVLGRAAMAKCELDEVSASGIAIAHLSQRVYRRIVAHVQNAISELRRYTLPAKMRV